MYKMEGWRDRDAPLDVVLELVLELLGMVA
jgi:hypothetical protein